MVKKLCIWELADILHSHVNCMIVIYIVVMTIYIACTFN